ncbi:MAG: hypothetical protein WBL85_10000 [Sedimentisphaerales bacterium]
MDKSKLGLQKEVSKIFTGIQIPKKNVAGPDASSTVPASPITPHTQVAPAATPAPATPPARVITPALVATSTTVIPAVTAPASTVPAPVATPAKTVTPKPAVVSPKPFTIQEPPTQATSQPTRQVVYEPPKPRQTAFEPSAPASLPVSAPAKQSKSEFVIKQPKDSPLLKIIDKVKAKLLTLKHGAASGRQKMMLLLSPVLAIVLLLVVVNAVKTSPGISVKPSNKAVAPVLGSKINWEIPQPIPANLRDPMVFGAVSTSGKGTAEGPAVKGIVYSEDNPSAIVGDRIVSAGDTVAGATIVKINPDSVDFAVGDKKWSQKVEH